MIRLVTHNIAWKLASLGIAVLLWVAVVEDPELTTTISVPVEFRNLPKDLEISSEAPERLHLEVSGPSGRLGMTRLTEARAVIDLRPVNSTGERTFTVAASNINLPSGVTLNRATPSQVRLRFERRLTRSVPVRIRHGSPPAGYRIARVVEAPDHLNITGPESRVQRIDYVESDTIDVSAVVSEASFSVQAYVADPQVRFEGANVVQVKVTLEKIPSGS